MRLPPWPISSPGRASALSPYLLEEFVVGFLKTRGLMNRLDFSRSWLAVSGRLPSDMVLKPALVGIPLVASVSAPTSAGVEMGDRVGITVVGFTRGGRLNCYTRPDRIMAL